jgi:fatty acid desaturase
MNMARALWASIQGDPAFMKSLHAWLTIFWLLVGMAASVYAGLQPDSPWLIPLLVFVSFYANFAGHFSSWQAARVEVRQEEIAEAAAP